jgi:hypothetical protein
MVRGAAYKEERRTKMGKGIDCVRMNIDNGRLESAGWQATVTYYSNVYPPNLGKHISAKLTQRTEDEMIERIWEEYFTTLEEAVEWLQVEAEKIVRESLDWKVKVGNTAQKDIEYLNEYGFEL